MINTRPLGELVKEHGGLIQTGPFGSQLHERDYVEEGVPVIMPKDIVEGCIDDSSIAKISQNKAATLSRHALLSGNIVLPRRGDISKCALIDEHHYGYLCGTGCMRIKVPETHLLPRFFYYYLGLREVISWLEGNAVGTTMLNLSASILARLPVPSVNLNSQERIVNILSAYDDLIENNRRRIRLLEESARLLYKEWFVHLRFPGHEHVKIVDGMPEEWVRRTAFEVVDVLSGGTPKTTITDYWNGEIPFFTPKDVPNSVYVSDTEKSLTESGLKNCNSKLYPKDTIFITARGTVGNLCLAQRDMAMNQSCYALIAKEPVKQYFLYFALLAAVEQLKSRAVGAVFDAIVRDTFKHIPFIVPSDRLVADYEEAVRLILRQIDNLLQQNNKLRQARDLLLPRLMSGELAV